MADIELPQLGESVTEGTITRWFKSVGEQVAEDEPLYEVSTDKVDSEVPSPSAGYLAEILVEEGDTVDVGTKVAVLSDGPPDGGSDETETGDDAGAHDEPEQPETGDEAGERDEPEQPDTGDAAGTAVDPEPSDAPAPSDEDASSSDAGSGEEDEVPPAAEAAATDEAEEAPKAQDPTKGAATKAPRPSSPGGPVLSPVVRRLLDQAGVEASEVTGTGIGGRITRSDAEAHVRDHGGSTSESPARPVTDPSVQRATHAAAPARPARNVEPTVARGSDQAKPLSKIRAITAEHMVRSLETSAHAYVATEVDYEAVERVRTAQKVAFKQEEGTSLTYLPFVARAVVDAVGEYPQLNASMGDEAELVVHGSVNLGIAVDLEHEGLIVPVVHDAQDQRLRAIARHVADLAGRARGSKLTADDITGGTVTITNIGSTANAFLLPIINQPQVMILSTDGVRRRPVVVTDEHGSESIAIHSVGNLTLGWDHRAFDGAYAAEFLARVREILETRDWESEL